MPLFRRSSACTPCSTLPASARSRSAASSASTVGRAGASGARARTAARRTVAERSARRRTIRSGRRPSLGSTTPSVAPVGEWVQFYNWLPFAFKIGILNKHVGSMFLIGGPPWNLRIFQ